MDSIFNYIVLFLILFVLPGGIVLTILGTKFKNRAMAAWGWLTISLAILGALATLAYSGWAFIIFILSPLLLIILAALFVVWLIYSISLIINGFKQHNGSRVALGFVFIGVIISVTVVPVVLISIFGSPISLM